MVKLSKKVLARREFTEQLADFDLFFFEGRTIASLVEEFGLEAVIDVTSSGEGGYYGEDYATFRVVRYRQETDEEYNARIDAEKERQRKAAKTRTENRRKKAAEAALAEEEERKLYLSLHQKYGGGE